MRSHVIAAVFLLSMMGLLKGCTGEREFLIVQVCFRDEQDLEVLSNMMKSTAQLEGKIFTDSSAHFQRRLSILNASPNYRVISLSVSGEDGEVFSAVNFGLQANQVAIGFLAGSNSGEARRSAAAFVEKLKQRWHVYYVPPDTGALPIKACEVPSVPPTP